MADEQKGTEYVILGARVGGGADPAIDGAEDPTAWIVVGRATAANDLAAIKALAAAEEVDLSNGAVAVPARSWRPRKPKDETITRRLWT